MSRGISVMAILVFVFAAGLVGLVSYDKLATNKAMLVASIAITAVTAVYALFTYELLRQNKKMAEAATKSAETMESGLRFSMSAKLIFNTATTKSLDRLERAGWNPIQSEDYERALREARDGNEEREYVFALLRNVGQGPATKVHITAEYTIFESVNPNPPYPQKKEGVVQLLEPNKTVALLMYVAREPRAEDSVSLVKATILSSDLYREAQASQPEELVIHPETHECLPNDEGCILTVN